MNELDYLVLKNAQKHFVTSSDFFLRDKHRDLAKLIFRLCYLSNLSRKEGLLSLEEYANAELNPDSRASRDSFLYNGLILIVDGTDEATIEDLLSSKILVNGTETYQSYLDYIALKGILGIYRQENPRAIEQKLYGCIPERELKEIKQIVSDLEHSEEDKQNQETIKAWRSVKRKDTDNPFLPLFESEYMSLDEEQAKYFRLRLYTDAFNTLYTYCHDNVRESLASNLGPFSMRLHLDTFHRVEPEDLTPVLDYAMKIIQLIKNNSMEDLWARGIPI